MKAIIHYARVGKPETVYIEQDILRDDGITLVTRSRLPLEMASAWSRREWQAHGILAQGEVVRVVEKHHFYQEWFDILALFDGAGRPLGWYCDVVTPLQKVEDGYFLRDLLLDLWIWPDGQMRELDWDEFEEAFRAGSISAAEHQQAQATLARMVAETRQGIFPHHYLGDDETGETR